MLKITYSNENDSIIIVGVNSGIGQALAESLLSAGVEIFGIDIQNKSSISPREKLHYYECKPQDEVALHKIALQIKGIRKMHSGLVNLSGAITHFEKITELSAEDWKHTYDISFRSCYNACRVFADYLDHPSSIVNMSSGLAFGGQKGYGPYAAAKASIISITKTLATELAPHIRVNSVAPGAVNTDFIKNDKGETRFSIEDYQKITPLGNMATPEEIADVIMFLLSDGSRHITGQCIHVNGGAFMV